MGIVLADYPLMYSLTMVQIHLFICIAMSHLMQDEHGETALHTASAHGHIDVARHLLEKGATVNSLTKVRL